MKYEGIVYRPPSEAKSLIIQITIGCAHNRCTFCNMYRGKAFRLRSLEDIVADLAEARAYYPRVERIFLADGDGLVMPTETLLTILSHIQKLFPECQRVGIYAAPKDILRKQPQELKQLKEAGLGILYMGVESGSDRILQAIQKGATAQEMIEAGKRVKESGIGLSLTLISGLGGKEAMREHAESSAQVVSAIAPEYVSFLTLMLEQDTPLYEDYQIGKFKLLTPLEVMQELKIFLEHLQGTRTVFRANHPSNYISLAGTLPYDQKRMLKEIEEAIAENDYRPENYRRL